MQTSNQKTFNINPDVELIRNVTREDLAKKHGEICDGIKELYARKNHDYGTVFEDTFSDYGLLAPVVRFRDKLGRIETLLQVKNLVEDESIKDTIHDLANYCIMTCAVIACIEDEKEKQKVQQDISDNTKTGQYTGLVSSYREEVTD